jgi:protein TonB
MAESIFSKVFNNWNLPESESRLDLVFDDRFKDYGAYQIRKNFRRTQALATIVAAGFAIFLSALPSIIEGLGKEDAAPKKKVTIVTDLADIEEPEKEDDKPKEPPKVQEPEPVASTQYVTPRINENAANDDEIAPPDFITNTGVKTQAGITDPTMPDLGNDGTGGPITNSGGDGPVADVAVKASFPGGEAAFRDYISSTFQYPVRCQDEGINGSVILRFIVDKTGKISNIQVVEETKSCPEFTEEAKRVLKNSKRWIPGQNKGQFVVSWREVPIRLSVE